MALLQISEPGMSTAPHQHKLAIGIDLGTTNSLVAAVRSGESKTLPDSQGAHLLPSIVSYADSDEVLVGTAAEARFSDDPLNTISSVKRLMGRSEEDLAQAKRFMPYEFATEGASNVPRIQTRAGNVTPVEVSAEILKHLKARALDTLGGDLEGAVITVPAYFDDAQRQATKDAARLADLKILRLLNEPTAAAVAYGLDHGAEGIIAVYDLGGGTFDVSILRLNKGVFEVMATGGDSALGGDDFDQAIATWMLEQIDAVDEQDHAFMRRVLQSAKQAKVALTTDTSTTITLRLPNDTEWQAELALSEMNALIAPLVKRTILSARRALRDAGVTKEDVLDTVMVGGSTRVLSVREQVGEFFGKPPLVNIDPDRVVAIGAAVQADALAGNTNGEGILLLDVTPLSLGIETMGGLVEKVIPRNTTIPVARAQEFTTYKDGQTAMAVHILQGERELVSDTRSLARFELRGIPAMVAGAARIRVTFQVDADGLLNVTAEEILSGVKAGVEVKPSYGLLDEEVERMLRESMSNAQEDMEQRRLREEQVEAERVLEALDAALAKDGDALLQPDEKTAILQARDSLAQARDEGSHAEIRDAIKVLEAVSEVYVARRMNESVRVAMAGHQINEFSDSDKD